MPSFDDASAEEMFAAAAEAMAKVGSFACALETTFGELGGEWDTITIESEFRDAQNYRRSMSVHIPSVPFAGPSEFALVRGKAYRAEPEGAISSAEISALPTYNLPADVTGLERLAGETLEGLRVYHLRGTRPTGDGTSVWTVDLFIDAATLLLVRSETGGTVYVANADRRIGALSTSAYSRFGEDFDIVPPDPASTPTPDPTPTPR